ncbi:unnamed protein product [Lactuca virosa]|uniref:Uncharacterized protein n=1 Tax=Lactuca virosa TaxID=75947 RepID=A0AAU9NE83_9ASTR|nr:unnamed protein product [Lactuca virosa]
MLTSANSKKVNVASRSRKDKGKEIDEDDEEENLSESEKLVRKKRGKELDELNALRQKLDAEDAEVKNSAFILEIQKYLFPTCTIQRIQKQVVELLEIYWLEPKTPFDSCNDIECQLDFPLTPRAFLFRCFQKIEKS